MKDSSLSYIDQITIACARTLWAMAWGDAMDEAGLSTSGCDLYRDAPETPALAIVEAARIIARAETDNRLNVFSCLAQASERDRNEERFGMCLAYSYVGASITWHDDHSPIILTDSITGEKRRFKWPHGESPHALCAYAQDVVAHHAP